MFSFGRGLQMIREQEEEAELADSVKAGQDRFNRMMAARDSGTPQPTQQRGGLSGNFGVAPMTSGDSKTGYDRFQAMQAARTDATNSYNNSKLDGFDSRGAIGGLVNQLNNEGKLFTNTAVNQQPGYDKFQAMQAARDNTFYQQENPFKSGFLSGIDMSSGQLQDKMQGHAARQRSEQAARFNAAMGANPFILQQLQMGQRQMVPQFNYFGFGAQPGLAAQGGQGGSMLANMSSQGLNQLAAGQQNNPTIFKAKS